MKSKAIRPVLFDNFFIIVEILFHERNTTETKTIQHENHHKTEITYTSKQIEGCKTLSLARPSTNELASLIIQRQEAHKS